MIPEPDHIHDLLGTERANGEPSLGFENRRKRCYELAAYALVFGDAPADSILVHGSIDGTQATGERCVRLGHAWLLLPYGQLWEPIRANIFRADAWVRYADALEEKRYTLEETKEMLADSGHYGRWHKSGHP